MSQPPLHAIFFDHDETLLGMDMAAMDRLFTQIQAAVPGLPVHELLDHWEHWPEPWPQDVAAEPAFWKRYWRTFAQRYALPHDMVDQMQPFGAPYHTCFYAYPDTLPCISVLRTYFPATRLALLTDFALPSVIATLEHATIYPAWFSLMTSRAPIAGATPDSHGLERVCTQLHVDPQHCVLVDDRPANVRAAAARGIRGILIDRGDVYQQWDGERIHSLRELPTHLLPGYTALVR